MEKPKLMVSHIYAEDILTTSVCTDTHRHFYVQSVDFLEAHGTMYVLNGSTWESEDDFALFNGGHIINPVVGAWFYEEETMHFIICEHQDHNIVS